MALPKGVKLASPELPSGVRPVDELPPGVRPSEEVSADQGVVTRGQRKAEAGGFTTRPTEPGEGSLAGPLFAALEVVDRPRAAIVGALLAPEGQSWDQFKKELAGEGTHPLMGDYIFNKLMVARHNPEAHPYLTNVRDFLGKRIQFKVPTYVADDIWDFVDIVQEEQAKTEAVMATIGGIATDIALDPITYTGVSVTKKGLIEMTKSSLEKEGKEITDPKLKAKLEKLESQGKIQEFKSTLADQLRAGQKRVRVAGVPIPGKVSGAAAEATSKFKRYISGTPLGESFTKSFSTKAGLEGNISAFAELEERLVNIIIMGEDKAIRDGAEFAREIQRFGDEIAATTGRAVPVEELHQIIVQEVERAKLSSFVNDAPVSEVAKGGSLLNKDWRKFARMLDAKARQYVRPEAMDDTTKAFVLAHPTVKKWVLDLKNKNAQQIIDEVNAGIAIIALGRTSELHIAKMEAAVQKALKAGVTRTQNPITRKPISVKSLQERIKKLKQAVKDQDQLYYFIHAITPEAKNIIAKRQRKLEGISGKKFSVQHASTLQRRLQGKSIVEINQLAREGKLPGYEGVKINQFFYEDPALAQTIRDIRHRKAMAVADFFNETKAQFGRSVKELREEAVTATGRKNLKLDEMLPEGWSVPKNPKAAALLKGHAFPDEITQRLDAHYENLLDPEATGAFLDLYDEVQNWWKAWTLSTFPSYHARNAVGNVWNNFVTGTNDPAVYKVAFEIQRGKQGILKTKDGRRIDFDEIRDHMDELGVRNRGFIGTDIETSIQSQMGKAKWLTLSRDSKAIYYGRQLGMAVENNARIAKFIDELRKGRGVKDAAQATKHALFDYTDLTHFEKKVAKRLVPFYTWSRKNLPLQVEHMVKSPGKYKAIDTIRQEIEANVNEPNEYVLADWMLENYPIRIKIDETDGKPRYFLLGGWLPAADVWSIAADPQQMVLNQITPLIKVPGEFLTNKDWFTMQDIKKYPGEEVSYLGDAFRIDPHLKKMLNNVRVLATADAMLPDSYKGVLPQTVRDMTAEERLTHFLTGIKLYGIDLDQQRYFNSKETLDKIQKYGYYRKMAELPQKLVREEEKATLDAEIRKEIERVEKIYGVKPDGR